MNHGSELIDMPDIIHVMMVRENLDNLPYYPVPDGYSIRRYQRGEKAVWAEINSSAGNIPTYEAAIKQFENEFAAKENEMEDRCFFVVHNESGRSVGTNTAWYDENFADRGNYGRIHWVAMDPAFQGKGLAKPLMYAAMERLRQSHTRVVLSTQTFRVKAINMYLDFGFVPHIYSPNCKQAWQEVVDILKHPALIEWLKNND